MMGLAEEEYGTCAAMVGDDDDGTLFGDAIDDGASVAGNDMGVPCCCMVESSMLYFLLELSSSILMILLFMTILVMTPAREWR